MAVSEEAEMGAGEFAATLLERAEIEAGAKVVRAQADLRRARIQIRMLEKDRDEILAQFRHLQDAIYPPAAHFSDAPAAKGEFLRVVIPDVHGSSMDLDAVNALFGDIKRLKPDEVVLIGDLVECGGFASQHHVMGYVSQTEYTYQQDIVEGNWFLDELAKAAPDAVVHYLEGNHEDRIERWVVDQTMRNERDGEFLRTLVSPEFLLQLGERGIKYYRRGEYHMGLEEPGMIKLGKIFFVHQMSGAKNAAAKSLEVTAGNIVFGHTHREDSATLVFPGVGLVKAWNPGCLCKRQPLWRHSSPTNWSHGYGVELVSKSGNFLHVNVPIWRGQSLLGGLSERLGK